MKLLRANLRFEPTGTPAARASRRAAFTLIEIMMVVCIIGLAMATGIPLLRNAMHRQGMDAMVFEMQNKCDEARRMAIMNGGVAEMVISPPTRGVSVRMVSQNAPVMSAAAAQAAAQAAANNVQVARPTPTAASSSQSFQWSDHILLDILGVNFVDCTKWDAARIRFYANGTCDDMAMVVHSESGESRKMTLDVVTANLEVVTLK